MSTGLLLTSALFFAYQWYFLKEKRLRITLTPKEGVEIYEHSPRISTMFASGRLSSIIGLAGYLSVSSHVETLPERVIITIDMKYRSKITWDIGSLYVEGFDVQCSEIYDR